MALQGVYSFSVNINTDTFQNGVDSQATIEEETFTVQRLYTYQPPVIAPNFFKEDYVDVTIQDISNIKCPGQPCLPAEYITIMLEPNMLPTSVEVIAGEPEVIQLERSVTPMPEPMEVSEIAEYQYYQPEHFSQLFIEGELYQQDEFFPSENYKYDLTFGLTMSDEPGRDLIKLSNSIRSEYVDVILYPVQYNPVTNELLYYPELELKVEYRVNPDYFKPLNTRSPDYDMLIITPYVSNLQALADQRNYTGLQTKVVSTNDIYNNVFFTVTGADNQEKIKKFIWNAVESWNVTFVLLGGDSGQIPARYIYVSDGADGTNTPCDLYYGDVYKSGGVFASWNADSDSVWGEHQGDITEVDLRPDVYYGRLPCSSTAQANMMYNKISNYEGNTHGATWFKNITLLGLNTFVGDEDAFTPGVQDTPEGEYMCENLKDQLYKASNGWGHNRLYDSLGTLTKTEFGKAQSEQVGFMAFSDHGNVNSWGLSDISNTDVNSMTNGDKLPIVSVDACLTGAFESGGDCFAECFLKNSNGGGVASFAASRIGFGYMGPMHISQLSGAINTFFHEAYTHGGADRVGLMYSGAQNKYITKDDPKNAANEAAYKTICEYILFGDPGLSIGGFYKTNAKIYCDKNTSSLYPGDKVSYNISLENLGDARPRVTFLAQKINNEWTVTLNETTVVMKPYENMTIQMNITAQMGATAGEIAQINFVAKSANLYESPLAVRTYNTVKAICNYTFLCHDNEHNTTPSNQTIFAMVVTNSGNGQFNFNLTAVGAPVGWGLYFSEQEFSVEKFKMKTIQLYVTPPATELTGQSTFKVECRMLEMPGDKKEADIIVNVIKTYGLTVEPRSPTTTSADPGGDITYDLLVTNIGNHPDTIDLTYTLPLALQGSTVSFDPGTNIPLEAYANQSVTMDVTLPSGLLADEYFIKITGTLDSDKSTENLTVSVIINPFFEFLLSNPAPTKETGPSTEVSFDLSITNRGNKVDSYQVLMVSIPEDWEYVPVKDMTLDPLATQEFTIDITTPPEPLLSDTFNLTFRVESNATKEILDFFLEVTIAPQYGFKASADETDFFGDPETTVKIPFEIENLGNIQDSYVVTASTDVGWETTINGTPFTLDPFIAGTVEVESDIPDQAPVTTINLSVEIVSVSKDTLKQTLDFTITVNHVHGVFLEAVSGKIHISPEEDSEQFEYTVTNTGNGKDTYRMSFKDKPTQWTLTTEKLVELDPGETYNGTVDIIMPNTYFAGGTYDITLRANSEANPDALDSLTFNVEVDERQKTDPGTETNDTEEDTSGFSGLMVALVVIPIVVILLVIVLVIIFIVLKKKGKKEPEPEEEDPDARWKRKQTDEEKQAQSDYEAASPEEQQQKDFEALFGTSDDEEQETEPEGKVHKAPDTWTPAEGEQTTDELIDDISKHLDETVVEAPEMDEDPIYQEMVEEAPEIPVEPEEMLSEEEIDEMDIGELEEDLIFEE
jgi:uncharacterized membrane protein